MTKSRELTGFLARLSSRRAFRRLVAVACGLVLVGATGVLFARSLDRATPVSTADAVARFRSPAGSTVRTDPKPETRSDTTTPRPLMSDPSEPANPAATNAADSGATGSPISGGSEPDNGRLPAEGVYVYDTTGSETVDVLGGSTHNYPAQTSMTIRDEGCGTRTRWDALAERWDERLSCTTDLGEEMQQVIQHHEFFGQADQRTFTCDPGSLARPANPQPGFQWTTRCVSSDSEANTTAQVVAIEMVSVGGQPVETVHIHYLTTVTGATRGTQTFDDWLSTTDGLVIRRQSSNEARANSSGVTTHYQEHYELALTSLAPRT